MTDVLVLTNTDGGIGMEKHAWQKVETETGYKEALLDVFLYLTGNEQILDVEKEHLALIEGMVAEVNRLNGWLIAV